MGAPHVERLHAHVPHASSPCHLRARSPLPSVTAPALLTFPLCIDKPVLGGPLWAGRSPALVHKITAGGDKWQQTTEIGTVLGGGKSKGMLSVQHFEFLKKTDRTKSTARLGAPSF